MLSNKQSEFIRQCIRFICTRVRLGLPPDGFTKPEWRGLLLKLGFDESELKGLRAEKPTVVNIGRSDLLSIEQFRALTTNDPIE